MLEQELHNQESNDFNYQETPVRKNTPEADLFRNYEIKNWDLSPRIYKILAVSAIFNVMALFIFAQSNLLTRKGCDSPMVSKVCQVLDTVYIGSILLGTERDFVDADYEKTELGDAEITYIDVSGQTPPLNYPEGYFALANPEEYAMRQQQQQMMNGDLSGFSMPPTGNISTNPTLPNNDLMNVTPTLPPQNNNPISGSLPISPLGSNPTVKYPTYPSRKFPRPKPIKTPKLNNQLPRDLPKFDEETAKNEKEKQPDKNQSTEESKPLTDVDINIRPIKDLGVYVKDLLDKKQINLETEFVVGAKGKLNKEGRIDPKTFKYTKAEAAKDDKMMIEVVQQSIEAINASGYLQYLKDLSGKDLTLLFQQDDVNLTAVVESELESESRAKSIKSGLDLAISLVKMRKTGEDADENDKDDLELLKNATIENNGKKIVIKFTIPKAIAQQMIQRKLLNPTEEPKKPNGTAQNKDANLNTVK